MDIKKDHPTAVLLRDKSPKNHDFGTSLCQRVLESVKDSRTSFPCSALKIVIFVVQSSFGFDIFRLREDIKKAGILDVCLLFFIRTISGK